MDYGFSAVFCYLLLLFCMPFGTEIDDKKVGVKSWYFCLESDSFQRASLLH